MNPISEFENRSEAGARMRASKEELLRLLEDVPALVWETDRELRVTFVGGAAARMRAARTVEELFGGARAAAARQAHEQALEGKSAAFEVEVNARELRAHVQPLRGAGGAIVGAAGLAIDMTERVVAERALRFSEHGYRTMVEESPYAICRSTTGGALLQLNAAMAHMLGYDGASATELLLRDLPAVFRAHENFEHFRKTMLEQGTHPGVDAAWVRRDGSEIQVRVSGRVARLPSGEISHFDVFAEDVTEMKRLEGELSHAQKMQAVGQLAGGVAHDFNNLLTVITGHVELLLQSTREAAALERLGEIRGAAERAAWLTNQLLAFSRRQVLRSRTVDLNEVIDNLTGMLGRVIKENIELAFDRGTAVGCVNADPNEIERVLVNLAVNAQDAMPAGGRLTIRTARVLVGETEGAKVKAGEYVELEVRDTGVGMTRETMARVFEPFFTTKASNGGTGLGLSVVYGIVRQSGGTIQVESQPGAGTTFRIRLPRVEAATQAARPADPRGSIPGGTETILFAEDDTAIRILVTRTLEVLGYRVLSAPDGLAALELAGRHQGEIDMLLTDVIMPSLGGHELAERLKDALPELKVAFVSGYAGDELALRKLGQARFLQKPFTLEALARLVRGVLDGEN
jgi:two-component system, cell cycle sensor histidine kinase and response regulator CckA